MGKFWAHVNMEKHCTLVSLTLFELCQDCLHFVVTDTVESFECPLAYFLHLGFVNRNEILYCLRFYVEGFL